MSVSPARLWLKCMYGNAALQVARYLQHPFEACKGCEAFSKRQILPEIMNQHRRIKFWRCLHAVKWTLNAMKPLPRSHSIDFVKISTVMRKESI